MWGQIDLHHYDYPLPNCLSMPWKPLLHLTYKLDHGRSAAKVWWERLSKKKETC